MSIDRIIGCIDARDKLKYPGAVVFQEIEISFDI